MLITALCGVTHSAEPLETIRDKVTSHFQAGKMIRTRQSDCTLPSSYPERCVTAANNVVNSVANIQSLQDINLDMLNSALNEFCTNECIGPQVEFYECLGQQDVADFLNRAYCGQSSGTNCFVLWIDGTNGNSIVTTSTCSEGGTCDSQCQNSLQTTADFLGCCAASFYNNSFSPFSTFITPQEFATCDINLGAMCEGASGAGTNWVGLEMLTVVVAVATLSSAIF